jgi:TldD protein
VSAGRATRDELLDACGTGLYVREIAAGHTDAESGRFTLFVESADLVRRGRLGAPVAPFVLTSDVLTALRNLYVEPGEVSAPASGLGLCVKRGEPLPVGGASPAILLRGLTAVPGRP